MTSSCMMGRALIQLLSSQTTSNSRISRYLYGSICTEKFQMAISHNAYSRKVIGCVQNQGEHVAPGAFTRSYGYARFRDTTIAFYVTSTSRLILSLNLKRGKEIECELVGDPLQFSRWYHFAFDYSATGHLNAYLNGIATAVTCTYNGTNRINIFDGDNFLMQRIGFVPTGSIAYDKRENEAFYMTIGSCSHSTEGPSPEDFLFSGMISNFTLFMSALDASAVRAIAKEWVVPIGASVAVVEPSLQLLSSECLSCDSSDSKHKVQHRKDDSPIDASSEFSSIRSNWRVFGSLVSTVDPQFGDCVLSVMLSVAQAKVDLGNAGAKIKLGNLFNMTDESQVCKILHRSSMWFLITSCMQVVNRALVATLNKHFLINEEQEGVWNALNMYSTRLEMVGHSLSLTNKELVSKDVSVRHRDNPIVALITPVTSRGTEPTMLGDLPLLRALLPSLYATRSAGFDYKVYLIVNEHDKVFGNSNLVRLIFSMAKETWKDFFLQESLGDVDYEVVIVPDSMTPKHALSGLFNHGTLRAYHDNCDYFYLVNDDLLLISPGWTELFTQSLLSSPMLPGLGVAGGVDVSDSITPQIEFPFFHRTHVNIFHWCGANPWTFSNWWEDNWLTDVYIPFNAVFYESRVLLSNYVGLDRSPVSNSVSSDAFLSIGTLDPRYEVVEGRRTPDFYRAEVERGRDLIVSYLQNYVSAKEVADINTSYCYREGGKIPTLASMHLNYHEEPLDPCDSHLESSPYDERRYRTSIHEKEMPHHSYAELVEKERELVEGETLMSKYYGGALFASAECQQLLNNGLNSQDAALMAQCAESVGITSAGMLSNKGYLINPPMLKGDLCRREGVGVIQYNSCALTVPRNVLIIHNHCPLFTRYGSDKRLFHIAETFRALGYNVHFGGMEVSGFETEDDHLRVKSLGARLYSPLTARTDAELFLDPYKMDTMLKEVQPDIVVLTMWFWNVDPVAVMFMRPVR